MGTPFFLLLSLLAVGTAIADPVDVRVREINRFDGARETFGDFRFMGGLVVSARGLSGLSAIALTGDGQRMVALGDRGAVFRAVLLTDGDGRLVGLDEADLAQRLGINGAPVSGKPAADAEAIAFVAGENGSAFVVAVERGRRLLAYSAGAQGPVERPLKMMPPADFDRLTRRGGLEALAVGPVGSLVAGELFIFHEKVLDGESRLRAWRGVPAGPFDMVAGRPPAYRYRPFEIVAGDDWSVTGAAFLPGGDLLLLERRYRGGIDIAMRIRRIGRDRVTTDLWDGPEILFADARAEIDNMEGIAVSVAPDGGSLVTLVSDDNANLFQRTLLLRFRLETPVPRPRPSVD